MHLSIQEAADVSGKTVRQLRYLIDKGILPASKQKGKWTIKKEDLPVSPKKQKAKDRQKHRAAKVAEEVLHRKEIKTYSMKDLRAFETGRSLYKETLVLGGDKHPVSGYLLDALTYLGMGVHAYQSRHKVAEFSEAREMVCRAVVHCYVAEPQWEPLGMRLEQELLPSISGLIKRYEGKRR